MLRGRVQGEKDEHEEPKETGGDRRSRRREVGGMRRDTDLTLTRVAPLTPACAAILEVEVAVVEDDVHHEKPK